MTDRGLGQKSFLQFPRGALATTQDHTRKPPGGSGGRSEGTASARAFIGISLEKEWMRQDRHAEQV